MSSPSSVGINDNLSASEASVSLGSSNNESSTRVENVPGVDEPFLRDGNLDNFVKQIFSNFFVGNIGVMLAGDQHGVHTLGLHGDSLMCVLNSDLNLGVRSHPGNYFLFAALFDSANEFTSEVVREGHEGGGLVSGIADHEALIPSSDFFFFFVEMNTLGDIWRLFVDGNDDGGSFVIHTDFAGVVSNFLDGLPGDLFEVDFCFRLYFSEEHAKGVLDCGLAGNLGFGVYSEAGIEDRVRNVVTKLVGMSAGNAL